MPIPTPVQSLDELLRARRAELKMSRERLAVEVGMSSSSIARIELEGHVPLVSALIKIADALDLDEASVLRAAATSERA